eukprot:Cvel_20614.t1-p1 / transcript=Cvel_20614.t1 / gene=Cvel_20614 / organism=Chromera_velia_CCMP2878 / gene_product=hypothetical protein / transcript_product=hypothetical protein / location=Cvel_scaffold1866:214-1566(-) / protein_length=451 / sequence_SO=supercontig / SO=protein_coding / is_pseudo=false
MAPKKKGQKMNLLDLQRELGAGDEALPSHSGGAVRTTREEGRAHNDDWRRDGAGGGRGDRDGGFGDRRGGGRYGDRDGGRVGRGDDDRDWRGGGRKRSETPPRYGRGRYDRDRDDSPRGGRGRYGGRDRSDSRDRPRRRSPEPPRDDRPAHLRLKDRMKGGPDENKENAKENKENAPAELSVADRLRGMDAASGPPARGGDRDRPIDRAAAIERDAKGSYVPPSMRRVLEEEKRREQSDSRPMRRGPPPTKDASDFPSLMAVKKDDEPEPKEDKEKKQKKKKNRPAPPAGGAAPPSATSTGVPSASGTPIPPGVEPELWQKFASLVHSALKSGKDAKQTASEAEEMLDESALKAPAASAEVIAVVLEENDKTEASLRQTCQKAAPLLKAFLAKRDEGSSPSPSVQLIRDCVLKAFKAGMPKVTDGEGLPMVKVVFEELEKAEVVSPEACVA